MICFLSLLSKRLEEELVKLFFYTKLYCLKTSLLSLQYGTEFYLYLSG